MEAAIRAYNAGQVRTWRQLSELIMLDVRKWRQLSELIMLDK